MNFFHGDGMLMLKTPSLREAKAYKKAYLKYWQWRNPLMFGSIAACAERTACDCLDCTKTAYLCYNIDKDTITVEEARYRWTEFQKVLSELQAQEA